MREFRSHGYNYTVSSQWDGGAHLLTPTGCWRAQQRETQLGNTYDAAGAPDSRSAGVTSDWIGLPLHYGSRVPQLAPQRTEIYGVNTSEAQHDQTPALSDFGQHDKQQRTDNADACDAQFDKALDPAKDANRVSGYRSRRSRTHFLRSARR